MGIEPTPSAWKAEVLPLNYTRTTEVGNLVEGGGFEPPKAEPSDLQSDPFDRSGTPPAVAANYPFVARGCQGFCSDKRSTIKVILSTLRASTGRNRDRGQKP